MPLGVLVPRIQHCPPEAVERPGQVSTVVNTKSAAEKISHNSGRSRVFLTEVVTYSVLLLVCPGKADMGVLSFAWVNQALDLCCACGWLLLVMIILERDLQIDFPERGLLEGTFNAFSCNNGVIGFVF